MSILHENSQHRAFPVVQEWYLVRTAYPLLSTSGATAQPSLSIEPYKYKLISMVEGRTLMVLLCCWIDKLAQDHLGEHRELESELLGMIMLGFMEMHVYTKSWL